MMNLIRPYFARFCKEISGNGEEVTIDYKPSIQCEMSTQNEWKNVFYSTLKNSRKKDILKGFSSVGPHRDELLLWVKGKPAHQFASQGQYATLTLALKLCSILCCEVRKKETMLFLFDDALTFTVSLA